MPVLQTPIRPLAIVFQPACPGAVRVRVLCRDALFLVKAARPGFWLTSMWFYLLPLQPNLPLHSFAFWLGLAYVGFPLGMAIYATNDLSDGKTDALNPRKDSYLFGARPTPEQVASLPLAIILVQVPFFAAFALICGPVFAGLWALAGLAAMLFYNHPSRGAKDRPWFDTLSQSGFTLVFVLSCLLNGRPQASPAIFLFGACFAMHSHLFGQVMDLEPDAAAGRRTTAVVIGPRWAKAVCAGLMLVETGLALFIPSKPWLVLICLGGAVFFAIDSWFLWRAKPYAPWQMAVFFLGWNGFLVAETVLSWAVERGVLTMPRLW